MSQEISMNLYDYTKQIVSQMTPLDPISSNTSILAMANTMAKKEYMMMYCKEISDFTIFKMSPESCPKTISQELAAVIYNRGNLIITEEQEDGAWELWIRDKETNKNNCYYLFDFSQAIVEVE